MKKIALILLATLSTVLYSQAPSWYYSGAYSVYDQAEYVAASAEGTTSEDAAIKATAQLSREFGLTITSVYEERVTLSNDKLDEYINDSTKVATSNDLINVKIADAHYDSRTRKYYAVAVMHKASTISILDGKVQNIISDLDRHLANAREESDMLKKYSILYKAANLSYKTEVYIAQLTFIGGSDSRSDDMKPNALYSAAKDVFDSITYAVSTQPEDSLIQGTKAVDAIESTIVDLGMTLSSSNPTYIFREKVTYDGNDMERDYPAYMLSCVLTLELCDSQGKHLTSFTFEATEGGRNEDDAKRNLRNAVTGKISESLAEQFTDYLKSFEK